MMVAKGMSLTCIEQLCGCMKDGYATKRAMIEQTKMSRIRSPRR
jgi:hypothetical protein